MDENILKKIKSLPPLDDTVLKIQRICVDKNSSLNDLVKVVESDPMLTANILKSSNSPLYGFSREIKNIAHAVSLFGMATVRGFALSSAIKQNIKINLDPYNIGNNDFLEISTLQSTFMFKWYSKVNKSMLDILQPAAFMMEVGKIIIAHELAEQNKESAFKHALMHIKTPEELSALEKESVGFSNEEVTAKIFEQWNLEGELVESIKFSNEPFLADESIQPYAAALNVVKQSINIFGHFREDFVEKALMLLHEYHLEREPFIETIEQFEQ
ncbi:HDOD domain-containing protein [Sulfurospirillum barnesii]|uniref:Putative signal transduction protein n=1 Tax=Sulfurospirillum barnesii (strain ATCC 700032 / DSM 10660 / SES-3) TaxID=760154 RepID=I3XWA0_SULBS|nr:HDOD domain-containing protein [Sulfurospirillum barnesii]AFL68224.1 putative signal transduction protein [Sulfurospirillum barnesii SES-3]